jgi:glucosyl-3-phosphoglycerate synthase
LRCIESASQQFLKTPLEVPYIANWNRVASAVPSIFDMLLDAVEADSKL